MTFGENKIQASKFRRHFPDVNRGGIQTLIVFQAIKIHMIKVSASSRLMEGVSTEVGTRGGWGASAQMQAARGGVVSTKF